MTLLYREPPHERATDKLSMHMLELDKFRKTRMDQPSSPLRCWLTAICRSQDEKKTLPEVVKMDEELQEYCDSDPGFAQFVERHGAVAALPDVRKAYRRWEYDRMLESLDEERRAADIDARISESEARGVAIGEANGEARGIAIGEANGEARTIHIFKLHVQGKSPEDISAELGISQKRVTDALQESGLMENSQ